MNRQIIMWDQGWGHIQKGITKVKRIMAKLPEPQFTSEEYMSLYTTIYNMCTQDPPNDYAPRLYEKYKETFDEYITSTVLPSLREKQHDESFLQELTKSWANHKVMVFWMSRFFYFLDRRFIAERSLPGTKEAGLNSFRDLVYREVNITARDVVLGLINKERDGEPIDRAVLRAVTDMFVEIDMGKMDAYELDLEGPLLRDTVDYYSRKASSWIAEDSYKDYMSKAEECLRRESEVSQYYLHSSSEVKLLDKVKHELLVVYATQLLEKEQYKVEDFSA